jgi:chromosome condensin MukBEF ATPase and DNA-binding subunit MukB
MELSPELIGALVIAFTSLLSGLTAIMSKRQRDQRDELDSLREDYKAIRVQLRLADQWIFAITRVLDQRGIPVPPPPSGLQTSNPEVNGDESA